MSQTLESGPKLWFLSTLNHDQTLNAAGCFDVILTSAGIYPSEMIIPLIVQVTLQENSVVNRDTLWSENCSIVNIYDPLISAQRLLAKP